MSTITYQIELNGRTETYTRDQAKELYEFYKYLTGIRDFLNNGYGTKDATFYKSMDIEKEYEKIKKQIADIDSTKQKVKDRTDFPYTFKDGTQDLLSEDGEQTVPIEDGIVMTELPKKKKKKKRSIVA